MRTPQEIISEFRNVLYWSQPNLKHDEMLNLINELENTLSPSEAVIEEQIIETIINNPIEFTEPTEEDIKSFNESVASFLEIEPIEEPITEQPVVAKRGAKKK
jgi:hypothetical protein